MITIFSIPKPFKEHISIIQRNAIQSWTKLCPQPEIILFGDEEGIEEISSEYKVQHVSNVEKNEFGTPLLHSIFQKVERLAQNKILCYINADIILQQSFFSSINKINFKKYLAVGQRWDVDIEKSLNFTTDHWEDDLDRDIAENGVIHPPAGSDYFVFPKGTLGEMPPFAVGRVGWDNWLIYHAGSVGLPVVDMSQAVKVIHQNHDYSHISKGIYSTASPENDRNLALMGRAKRIHSLKDADWHLTLNGRLKPSSFIKIIKNYLKGWRRELL